jgi:hypothetical protein
MLTSVYAATAAKFIEHYRNAATLRRGNAAF